MKFPKIKWPFNPPPQADLAPRVPQVVNTLEEYGEMGEVEGQRVRALRILSERFPNLTVMTESISGRGHARFLLSNGSHLVYCETYVPGLTMSGSDRAWCFLLEKSCDAQIPMVGFYELWTERAINERPWCQKIIYLNDPITTPAELEDAQVKLAAISECGSCAYIRTHGRVHTTGSVLQANGKLGQSFTAGYFPDWNGLDWKGRGKQR